MITMMIVTKFVTAFSSLVYRKRLQLRYCPNHFHSNTTSVDHETEAVLERYWIPPIEMQYLVLLKVVLYHCQNDSTPQQ